jgi:Immunoglobulin I-set domain
MHPPPASGLFRSRRATVSSLAVLLGLALCQPRANAQCGAQWLTGLTGPNGNILAVLPWDPDGAGPASTQLIFGGTFTMADTTAASRIARWDGAGWHPYGLGMNSDVDALTFWDSGSGPQLIAGGTFLMAEGAAARGVARWDGSAWHALNSTALNGSVFALCTWDPDGTGPAAPMLVLGGNFITALPNGGGTLGRVAGWTGSAWATFANGLNGLVRAVTSWDPDGAGPMPPQLIAGGDFFMSGGADNNFVARWDGSSWQPLSTGTNGGLTCLTTWDPDGDGPLNDVLVAGGGFMAAGGVTVNNIAYFDGSWHALAAGLGPTVRSLTTWDADGAGPLPPQLVVGGSFNSSGTTITSRIAHWNGAAWQPFISGGGNGTNNTVSALTTLDPDGTGPAAPMVVAAGSLTIAGNHSTPFWDIWTGANTPWISQQPDSLTLPCGADAVFTATPGPGSAGLSFQWRRGNTNLANGPTGNGSTVSGATTASLTITDAASADSGAYDLVVTNTCGSVTSAAATLTVSCCGSADFDGDGDIGTDADIAAFFECLGGSCCPTCGSPDFNGDGDIGTDADIEAFFRVLAGGTC